MVLVLFSLHQTAHQLADHLEKVHYGSRCQQQLWLHQSALRHQLTFWHFVYRLQLSHQLILSDLLHPCLTLPRLRHSGNE